MATSTDDPELAREKGAPGKDQEFADFLERFGNMFEQRTLGVPVDDDRAAGPSRIERPVEVAPAVRGVTFKPPQPLYQQNPEVWFMILEQLFMVSGITQQATMFAHAVACLDARLQTTFAGILLRPRGPSCYDDYKAEVLKILGETRKTKLNNLLRGLVLGDKKPSQLLNEFRQNAEADFPEAAMRQMWMSRLPVQVQIVLTPFENDLSLSLLAERADALLETMTLSEGSYNASVSSVSSPGTSTGTATLPVNDIKQLFEQFRGSLIGEVSQMIKTELGDRSRQRSGSQYRRAKSRSQSRRRIPARYETCFFHAKYNDKARNCRPGCKFFNSKDWKNKDF